MFGIETLLKSYGRLDKADLDADIEVRLADLKEAVEAFAVMRTALRRIVSMGDKNIPNDRIFLKYAKEVAQDALNQTHG